MDSARAELGAGEQHVGDLLLSIEHDLYVAMAELATDDRNRDKLTPESSLVTNEMVTRLESAIDAALSTFSEFHDFLAPGASRSSAALDVARTVVRRAERTAVDVAAPGSHVVPYLNRLSDLLWCLARSLEDDPKLAKDLEA